MIKDYNSTAYFSFEKFRSSERSLKMAEKPGMPYKYKFANKGENYSLHAVQLQWIIVGVRLFVCFLRKHILNLFWRS